MLIKLGGMLTLYSERGADIKKEELLRYFSEMVYFPSAFLRADIRWESLDQNSVRGTLQEGDLQTSMTFFFDEAGAIYRMESMRMYRDNELASPVPRKWYTLLSAYQTVEGYKIPSQAKTCWDLDEGAFCFFEREISELDFNTAKVFEK
jgi:hypothetical protein